MNDAEALRQTARRLEAEFATLAASGTKRAFEGEMVGVLTGTADVTPALQVTAVIAAINVIARQPKNRGLRLGRSWLKQRAKYLGLATAIPGDLGGWLATELELA